MEQFTITIVLSEKDLDNPEDETPTLNIKIDSSKVSSGKFAILSRTFKDLTLAGMDVNLQVSSDLAETAAKASEAGAFDD